MDKGGKGSGSSMLRQIQEKNIVKGMNYIGQDRNKNPRGDTPVSQSRTRVYM